MKARPVRALLTIGFLAAIPTSWVAAQAVDEQRLIARVKGTPVASLGVSSRETLERWVTRVVGRPLTWEVNDCGEGGDGRSAPICVEVARENPTVVLSFAVAGRDRRSSRVQLFYGFLRSRNGSEQSVKRLADVPALMVRLDTARP